MLNRISLGKVASIGLATTMALAFSGNNAKALDFSFSGVSRNITNGTGAGAGTLTASGIFRISDTAIPSSNLNQADLVDWKIEIFNSATGNTTTLFGDAGGFGTDNSDIVDSGTAVFFPTNLAVNNSTLDFSGVSGSLCISENGTNCGTSQGYFGTNDSVVLLGDANSAAFPTAPSLGTVAVASTPVPFEVSPTLGLLMVGGIWGVNRFRKSKKSLVK